MRRSSLLPVIVILGLSFLVFGHAPHAFAAQTSSPEQVQRITGRIEPGSSAFYRVADLRAGDTLIVYLRATSGNLDPAVAILDGTIDIAAVQAQYEAELQSLLAENTGISLDIDELRGRYALAWDDDSGDGYAAALSYSIPADGDYRVLVTGALSGVGRATFGDYELLVGINSPGILTGDAGATSDAIAVREMVTGGDQGQAVQEFTGTLSDGAPEAIIRLADIQPGSTVHVFVEGISGDLRPAVVLRDYGNKPLEAGNVDGLHTAASFAHMLPEGAVDYTLRIIGAPGPDGPTTGDFRLLIGRDAPDVLTGTAAPVGSALILSPIEVQIGLKLDRISEVDSQGEDYTVLGNIFIAWTDPALAFSPDTCNCATKVYTEKEFDRFLAEVQSVWPDFTFFNQQGNRWTQNRAATIRSDGSAQYYERFTTTFQADFDFSRFPFDTQSFPIYVDLVFPADRYVLTVLPDYTEISSEHGEDEFIITEFTTEVSTIAAGATGRPTSRFTFNFDAPRHLNYYALQIFVPILLIILISWFTFFMRDYTSRAQAAAANVLLFIAFSFSLADNYPRLGYLTFLDAIMAITFTINTLVVLYNVYLKRLENRGEGERAERIDHKMDWIYPLAYVAMFGVTALLFLWLPGS